MSPRRRASCRLRHRRAFARRIVSFAVIIAIGVNTDGRRGVLGLEIGTVPKIATLMDNAEDAVLAYMSFPNEHRVKMHNTNPIERLNGEIKRRTGVIGIFPSDDAIVRLVGVLLLERNDVWAVQRARHT
jgi:transposase-like protein